jgi:hypothetical protein
LGLNFNPTQSVLPQIASPFFFSPQVIKTQNTDYVSRGKEVEIW